MKELAPVYRIKWQLCQGGVHFPLQRNWESYEGGKKLISVGFYWFSVSPYVSFQWVYLLDLSKSLFLNNFQFLQPSTSSKQGLTLAKCVK